MSGDIELEIGVGEGPGDFSVQVLHSAGAGRPRGRLAIDIDAILSRRGELENMVLASAVQRRRVVPTAEEPLQEVGRQLFEALFTGPVGGAYRASLGAVQQAGKRLRVTLRLNAPELAALPWETMFDPEIGKYLCRTEPLVRYVDAPFTPEPLEVRLPLRILGLVAAPRGLPALDVEAEQQHLAAALAKPQADGLVELTWAPDASWDTVHDLMLGGTWHILHFIGHGDYDASNDEGLLALVGANGGADLVEASRLTDLLSEADPTPRLVVLNSCASGQSGAHDLFSGTAAALVHGGITAVAAMQFSISDTAAIKFAHGFYTAIAHGRPVDDAARSGRIGILGLRSLEWVTPVLYVRGDTAQLFSGLTGSPAQRPGQRNPTMAGPQPPPPKEPPQAPSRDSRAMLRALYVEAQAKLRIRDYDPAIELLGELLTLDPGNGEATELLERAQHSKQLAEAYTNARRAEDTGDWAMAISEYDRILQADPAYPDVRSRQDYCQKRQEIADRQAELRYHYDIGNWQAVLDVATQLAGLEPAAADPEGLATAARRKLLQAGAEAQDQPARPSEKRGEQAASGAAHERVSKSRSDYRNSAAASTEPHPRTDGTDATPPQVKTTRIHAPAADVPAVTEALCQWYKSQQLEVISVATSTGMMVQCRTRGAGKRIVGMGAALTVSLRPEGEDLIIEIGAAKWLGKGVGAGAGLLFYPALIAVGIGVWRQYQLSWQTVEFLRMEAPKHPRSAHGPQSPPRHPHDVGESGDRQTDR